MTSQLSPDYVGIELGIGESILVKAIGESTGRGLSVITCTMPPSPSFLTPLVFPSQPLSPNHFSVFSPLVANISKEAGQPGFNIAENMRTRAERTSISAASGMPAAGQHNRAKSIATMEPPRNHRLERWRLVREKGATA